MSESTGRWLRRDIAVALAALLLLLAWEASGADLPLTRLFGNADGFAWRNHWLLERVLHDGAAWCLQALFVLLGLNVLVPLPVIGAMPRALRLRWWLLTLLCALAISLLKRHSLVSCPWSLAEFGGSAQALAHGPSPPGGVLATAGRAAASRPAMCPMPSPWSAVRSRCARCRCAPQGCGWRRCACWASCSA